MRLHRFFVKSALVPGRDNSLSDARLVHQIRRVFRLHAGDSVIFFDGSGVDYVSEIVSMTDEKLTFKIVETQPVKREAKRTIVLAVSLIKKDNFEWVIQKGTELGVSEFIPLISERSEKKGFNRDRAEKIMIEACEQSGRAEVPVIREPMAFADFVKEEKRGMVAFHTHGTALSLEDIGETGEIVACIGPEGGWTDAEAEVFKEKGAAIVKLGTPVLRAETAAIAAATLLLV
ncbi:MAG TPA: RsmE family RNA methyltransferase [Candidatus Paceibacterota bacterium]|nr:RsmE family RNA methyltransferase [Candidatus Paceibacterota bacterium]